MVSSCVNPSSCGIALTNYKPFTIGKGSHSMSPLSKRSNNGSVACSTCGPSLSFGGQDPGARPWSAAGDAAGIGIIDFLVGKNILITGGTGFLAKEKILRVSPSVGKIYVVIKAKDTESAQKRLQNEVVDTELFKCLHEIHSKDYHGFLARKLAGDVTLANLGIDPNHAHEITEDVDIIVNSAANTTFDERYDVAMDINTLGPLRLMHFAHRFRKLKLFLQVSTAYVNGQRQGVVLEKPFRLGDTIANELLARDDSLQHKSGAMLNIEAEIKLAFDTRKRCKDSASFTQGMKCLGLERAKLHGWQDTYVFTKAMGEMVINCMRGDIPVVTIRPSVIESTLKDPIPGWIQGSRMMDPLVLNYGKGHLSGFIADPDCVFDMVPADMVVNVMLASMAKHGGVATPGMHVYHVGSSTSNPLLIGDLVRFISEHFERSPVIDAAGQPVLVSPFRLFDSMENFVSYEATSNARRAPSEKLRQGNLRAKLIEQITRLCRIYQPYTFYGGRFDSANMEKLLAEMEREWFHFDVRSVDWMDYVANVHIPGLRKHVMKGRGSPARI